MSPLYTGIGGVRKEITDMSCGISGVKRDMSEMWAGINGVKRQIFSSPKIQISITGNSDKISPYAAMRFDTTPIEWIFGSPNRVIQVKDGTTIIVSAEANMQGYQYLTSIYLNGSAVGETVGYGKTYRFVCDRNIDIDLSYGSMYAPGGTFIQYGMAEINTL